MTTSDKDPEGILTELTGGFSSPGQCPSIKWHERHKWGSISDLKQCPGLAPPLEHAFIGRPRICGRVGCGVHEEGLLERDQFCKACPNCGSDERIVCEFCRPGQKAAIDAAQAEFQTKMNQEMTRTKRAFAEAQQGHPGTILNLGRPKGVQIHVVHNNEAHTYHRVPDGQGWRIDAGRGTLIVGKGPGRVEVPLCNVLYFSPEEVG